MKQPEATRLVDVAAAAGVSLATASRAMSGGSGVSDELAGHVRAIADRLGYIPNVHARGLAGGLIASIGLVVHEIGDPYFAEISSGVIHRAAADGQSVQITHADRDPVSELAQVSALVMQRVGSIIIAGSGYTDAALEAPLDEALARYRARGGRVAVIGRHHLAVDAVLPDNVGAGRSIAQHLVGLGHRRVGLVAGPLDLNTVQDRLDGLRSVFARAGVATHTVSHAFTREGGIDGTNELLDAGRDVTAIVALNDAMALGALRVLRERGIRVPDEMSVAGVDDITVVADIAPALTTARIPMAEMGREAVALTLRREADEPRRIELGHELVVRQSTSAPRVGYNSPS
ncbi:LacI family DNA-binding transcriptional regulator [Agromyces sp. CFH 90414]|uniref:LacI family DNA-binding transcriptional regulator n=1 Tax=Agromyces agglutinans TaxID=2662258 RepID=A0A6I2F7H2_9MICO|nr:LacI family DNA-binding transcriptional regulator [Agromyces agglutinans]MRG60214.1 LacI family DNA-binding transcriptional regulator [Agromyces agglutinans]